MVIPLTDSALSLIFFLLIWLFISFTRRGREVQAVGGGRRESISAGVPVGRVIMLVFAISAACAALAGAVSSIKVAARRRMDSAIFC